MKDKEIERWNGILNTHEVIHEKLRDGDSSKLEIKENK